MRNPAITKGKKFNIFLDGKAVEAYEGEPVAVALYAAGIRKLWNSIVYKRPRGMFSLNLPCYMTVNGEPNVDVCSLIAEPDMKVETQAGRGEVLYD